MSSAGHLARGEPATRGHIDPLDVAEHAASFVGHAAATVADLILTNTQIGPGTVVPDPSANKTANNGPQSDPSIKEVKDERPAQ